MESERKEGIGSKETDSEMSALALRVAHDINNLLVGIMGNASLLLENRNVSGESLNLVNKIIDCAKKASEQTDLILRHREPNNSSRVIISRARSDQTSLGRSPIYSKADSMEASLNTNLTVLVIDDEEIVRSVSSAILERAGYQVITAPTGEEGLAIYEREKERTRCVLLDLSMPYMRGNVVFARLKAIDPAVKVFVMSGYSNKQAAEQFDEQGILGFIQKPFEPDVLLNAVRTS
jgi:CheY-like chemotaxis protein